MHSAADACSDNVHGEFDDLMIVYDDKCLTARYPFQTTLMCFTLPSSCEVLTWPEWLE